MNNSVEDNSSKKVPIAVDAGQFPSRLVQSIYHHLTEKTERISQIFYGSYKIDFNSIEILHNKISQTAARFHENEYSCELYHSLKNAESQRYSGFSRFHYYDRLNSAPTRALLYQFDFMSIAKSELHGDSPKPERYVVEVKMDQDVELDDDDETRPAFLTRIIAGRNISVKIEHVDYVIGRALITAVREWVESLQKEKENSTIKMIVSSSRYIEASLPPIVFSSFLGAGYFYWLRPQYTILNLMASMDILVYSLIFSIIFFAFSKYIISKSIDAAYNLQLRSYIILTEGDKNRHESMKQSRYKRNRILYGGLSLVIIPTIINLIFALLLLPVSA